MRRRQQWDECDASARAGGYLDYDSVILCHDSRINREDEKRFCLDYGSAIFCYDSRINRENEKRFYLDYGSAILCHDSRIN